MPRQLLTIKPIGRINRRNLVTQIGDEEVLMRENLHVIGDKEKYLKKVPGSIRYNSTSVGSNPVVSIFRYYSKSSLRKNFFFSGGVLYHIDDSGNTTALISIFSPIAYPSFSEMRVSGNDTAYFSEGISTGMYSYDGNSGNTWNKEEAVTQNFVQLLSFLDRLWGFEEDSEDLYFSANLAPTDFTNSTDAGAITIGARRGSKIMAIGIAAETLFIFKTDSIYVLEGRTPSEFQVREVVPNMGLAARRSLQIVESGFIGLMSDYEVYSFGGTRDSLIPLSYNLALSGDLTKDLNPILNRDRTDQVSSIYHNHIYRMAFTEDGQTQNNLEYCFNTINQTDFITRGNQVSSYLKYDRIPDKNELVTGRSDSGRLMRQYHSLNWDNDGTSPTMPIKLRTKFYGNGEPRNMRLRRVWLNCGVLGARVLPVKTYIDARNANSDSTTEDMDVFGESKAIGQFISLSSQDSLTSRFTPRHANSKCKNFSLEIDENINNRDFSMESFQAEIITKQLKRSKFVGV